MSNDSFLDWATLGLAAGTWGLLIAAIWAGRKAARGVREQIDAQRIIEAERIGQQRLIEAERIEEQRRIERDRIDEQRLVEQRRIDEQRLIERRQRLFDHQSVLSSLEFISMNAEAANMMEAFRSDRESGIEQWEALSDSEKLKVLAVLNYYELVATEYNDEFLDRDAANKNLAYTVIVTWEYAADFVGYLRSTDPAYFDEWKYLYDNHRHTIISSATRGPGPRDRGDGTDEHTGASSMQ